MFDRTTPDEDERAANLRRIRSCGIRRIAARDRAGEFAGYLSLPYHRQRRAQIARGNGRGCAGTGVRIYWYCRSQSQLGAGTRIGFRAVESAASADSKIATQSA